MADVQKKRDYLSYGMYTDWGMYCFRLSEYEEEEERKCAYERYRILVQNECAGGRYMLTQFIVTVFIFIMGFSANTLDSWQLSVTVLSQNQP